jgi:hypothetical protein
MTADAGVGRPRPWRLLIPDNTPLSLLGMLGTEALDWLFVPGAEVWVTDMVREEALGDPDPGGDPRAQHRGAITDWFARNKHRIRIQATAEGEEYRKAMETWRLAGTPARLKPSWAGRGEKSILQVLDGVERVVASGDVVLAIIDDGKARAAIRLTQTIDIDVMATETFIEWLHERFHVQKAATAWSAIKMTLAERAPDSPEEDPVHGREPIGLTSPHDILSAYSRGHVSSGEAMAMLGLDGFVDLLVAMADAGHPLPRPSAAEVEAQLEAALPLLRSVLVPEPVDA